MTKSVRTTITLQLRGVRGGGKCQGAVAGCPSPGLAAAACLYGPLATGGGLLTLNRLPRVLSSEASESSRRVSA